MSTQTVLQLLALHSWLQQGTKPHVVVASEERAGGLSPKQDRNLLVENIVREKRTQNERLVVMFMHEPESEVNE